MKHLFRPALAAASLVVLVTGCIAARPAPQQFGEYETLRPNLSLQRQPPTLELARPAFVAIIGMRPGIGADVIYPERGRNSELIAAGRHPLQGVAELNLPQARRSRGPCNDPGELVFWGPPTDLHFPPQATSIRVFNRRGRTITCYRLPGTGVAPAVRQHHVLILASDQPLLGEQIYESVAAFNRDPEIFSAELPKLAERLSSVLAQKNGAAWASQLITYER